MNNSRAEIDAPFRTSSSYCVKLSVWLLIKSECFYCDMFSFPLWFFPLCVSLCVHAYFFSSLNHTGVCKYRFNCVYYLLLAFFSFPSAFTEIICLITVTYKLIQTPKKQQRNNAHLTRRAYMWVCIRNVYSFYSIHFFPFITEITKIICIHISEHNFDEAGS